MTGTEKNPGAENDFPGTPGTEKSPGTGNDSPGTSGTNEKPGEKSAPETSGQDGNGYRFLDQTIKKRPLDKKKVFFHILEIAAAGVAIGLIASLVFNLMHPNLRDAVNAQKEEAKITIPADEDPDAESEEDAASSSEEASSEETAASSIADAEGTSEASGADSSEASSEGQDTDAASSAGTDASSFSAGTGEGALSGTAEGSSDGTGTSSGEDSAEGSPETASSGGDKTGTEDTSGAEAAAGEDTAGEGADTAGTGGGDTSGEGTDAAGTDAAAGTGSDTSGEGTDAAGTDAAAGTGSDASGEGTDAAGTDAAAGTGSDASGEGTDAAGTDAAAGTGSGDASGKGTDAAAREEDAEEEHAITLRDYRQVYQDMLEVAEDAEHSLVQVIGITSEMDYFNQDYENQQRLSGTIVAENNTDLFILTEYRAVDQVERIQIVFFDGSMTDGNFQKADQNTGLAILKVQKTAVSEETLAELTTAPLGNSYTVIRGEPVLALGSPRGYSDSIAYGIITSTSATASAIDREYSLLMTDIDYSSDGSGVLVDLDGKIVGIITHAFGTEEDDIIGLPISEIKQLIQDLSNNEEQIYVGIYGQNVTQDIADRTGIPRGVLVTSVVQDSPAMLAGIKEYDVIVKIGEEPIETMQDYTKQVEALEAGSTVTFTAMRKGTEGYSEITFEVAVESR